MSTPTTPKNVACVFSFPFRLTKFWTNDDSAMAAWFEARPINIASREGLTAKLRQRIDFVGIEKNRGGNVRMLDYACGSGFMSRVFAPYVETITAVDVDAGMVEMYKSRIGELGGRHKDTRAVVGDLLQDDTAADEHRDFDLITVGAALHAFPSAEDAVKSLAKRLAPGGVLFVQDRFDDGEYGGRGPRGFKEHGMRSYMSDAGLSWVKFEVLPEKLDIEVLDGEMASIWCFIARGMKPRGDKIEK